MARQRRQNQNGAIYHAFARGNRKQPVFLDDQDRRRYLSFLRNTAERFEWRCLAYCLMDNHLHLLVETPLGNLSEGMHRLQGAYAQAFNHRHRLTGHVFQGRYGAVVVTSDFQLNAVTEYIARNPVEAGLCKTPEEWPWSDYATALQRCSGV